MLYLAILAWIVGREGQAYRHSLAQRRGTTTTAAERAPQALPESAASTVGSAATKTAPITPPTSPSISAGRTQSTIAGTDKLAASALATTSDTADQRARVGVQKAAVDPRPANLKALSRESIGSIGDELFKVITAANDQVNDPAAIERLTRLARELEADQPAGTGTPVFHLLDSAAVNAFSHVPNHVYVSRVVFALAQDDAELQFVIAHELAHLRLGHPQTRLEQVARGPEARAGLVPWLLHLIALGYSDDQEFAADLWAYQALTRVGRSRREALKFLRRYRAHAEEDQAISAGRRPPRSKPGDVHQDLDNHYPAHPPAKERLARLEAIAAPAKTDHAPSS